MSDSEDDSPTRHQLKGRKRRVACWEESSSEEEEDWSSAEEDENAPEGQAFLTDDFDKQRYEDASAICELAEINARNLQWPFDHENPDPDCEGQHVLRTAKRMMGMLSFVVPTTTSSKWNPAVVKILRNAHSAKIEPVSNVQKEIIRQTGGRCQICGTKEHSCPWVIHLCGNKNRKTYNARDWEDVEAWPGLFDKFLPEYARVTECGWCPPAKNVPDEYLGAFAVGKDCYRKLLLAFVGQNLIMELIYSAWTFIAGLENDPGYREAPSVTDKRIQTLIKTIDDLQACAASDFPRVPTLPFEPRYWRKIDDHINKLAKDDSLKALEIGGMRARQMLQLMSGESDSSSDDEDDEECARGLDEEAPRASRRRAQRQKNDGSAYGTRGRQPAGASTSPVRKSKRKSPASAQLASAASRRPRRAAATAGVERRREGMQAERLTMGVRSDEDDEEEDDGEMQDALEESAVEEAKRQSMQHQGSSDVASSSRDAPARPQQQQQQHHLRADPEPAAGASDGAGRLRSMTEDRDPSARLLRGYDSTISEAIDLAGYLHRSGAPNWAAVAGRIVVTLQDLVEKNQKLRAR